VHVASPSPEETRRQRQEEKGEKTNSFTFLYAIYKKQLISSLSLHGVYMIATSFF